ncbi:MAG: hypothetical protein V3V74_01330 [Nitrosomonadaceae bacterium]
MSVYALSWINGSVTYVNGNTAMKAIRQSSLKGEEYKATLRRLKTWSEVTLSVSPCGESFLIHYGCDPKECVSVPVSKFTRHKSKGSTK